MKNFFVLLTAICGLCFLSACGSSSGKQGGGGGGENKPPSVTIVTSSSAIKLGQSAMLTWSSTNATSCTASAVPAEVDWAGSEPVSGAKSVTPGAIGAVTYTLACMGAGGSTSGSASVTASTATNSNLAITSGPPPSGTVGKAYDFHCAQIPPCNVFISGFPLSATGGVQPYSWSWVAAQGSSLPPGLHVGPTQALIDGKPTTAGEYSVVVTVTDSASPAASVSADYEIAINAAPNAVSANLVTPDHQPEHHHYKLIDIGTFGGPQSYLNGFEYSTFSSVQNLNDAGKLAGWADTSTLDPNCLLGNSFGNFCFNYDQPAACFGAIGCPGHISHAFQWQDGVRTDLGTLPGGLNSAIAWISTNGLIAGTSQNGETDPLDPGFPEDQAVLWKNGNIINLGTLPEGGYESGAQAVNSRGQVVGWAMNTVPDPNSMGLSSTLFNFYEPIYPFQTRAFLWQNGVMKDLGTLGTGTDAFSMAINEQGQVIGISYTSSTPNGVTTPCATAPIPTQDPFIWENGKMIDLGTLGGTCGFPSWINIEGQVVGFSDLAGDQTQHPFLWTKFKGMQDLGTLGGSSGTASMINDFGEVVGGSALPGDSQFDAFLWNGEMHDLGTLDGSNCAYAFSVNLRSQVVGNSGPNCATSAFLWEDGGPMVDLSTLASPNPGFASLLVININDRGEIAGIGTDADDNGHAVLLIPCDENHPGIEGCNYSLVDATTAAEDHPAQITQATSSSQTKLSMVELMARFRTSRGAGTPRLPATQTSPPQ